MDEQDIDWLIQDTAKEGEKWTELSLGSVLRTAELKYKNVDRQFNLVLALTSISVAFLTLVFPNSVDRSPSLIWAGLFSILTSVIGIILLVCTISRDDKKIDSDGKWELDTFQNFQTETADILSTLREYKKTPDPSLEEKLRKKFADHMSGSKKIHEQSSTRKEEKAKEVQVRILKILHSSFWIFFTLSFGSLIISFMVELFYK